MPYPSMLTKTWNDYISATNHPFETSQRTDLITVYDRQTVLDCGAFDPYATIWPMIENDLEALFWRIRKPKINVRFQQTPMDLYNAVRRTSSPSLSLLGCSWPILRLWQDRSQHRFAKNRLLIEYPKTACLDLTSGPRPFQGTGKHVMKSDLAQPVVCRLGTS